MDNILLLCSNFRCYVEKHIDWIFWKPSILLLWETIQHPSWLHVNAFSLFSYWISWSRIKSVTFIPSSIYASIHSSIQAFIDTSIQNAIYSFKILFTTCFMLDTEIIIQWNRDNRRQILSSQCSHSRLSDIIY